MLLPMATGTAAMRTVEPSRSAPPAVMVTEVTATVGTRTVAAAARARS